MKGKKLPAIGRIEFSVIDEQPVRLLEFDRGKLDFIEQRGEAVGRFLKNGELDPALAKRGIRRIPYAINSVALALRQHGRSGHRRHGQRPRRAAPRDRAWRSTSTR